MLRRELDSALGFFLSSLTNERQTTHTLVGRRICSNVEMTEDEDFEMRSREVDLSSMHVPL
jgi:hypothetical protein